MFIRSENKLTKSISKNSVTNILNRLQPAWEKSYMDSKKQDIINELEVLESKHYKNELEKKQRRDQDETFRKTMWEQDESRRKNSCLNVGLKFKPYTYFPLTYSQKTPFDSSGEKKILEEKYKNEFHKTKWQPSRDGIENALNNQIYILDPESMLKQLTNRHPWLAEGISSSIAEYTIAAHF